MYKLLLHKNKKKKIMPADSNAKEVPSYLYVVKINDPDFKFVYFVKGRWMILL